MAERPVPVRAVASALPWRNRRAKNGVLDREVEHLRKVQRRWAALAGKGILPGGLRSIAKSCGGWPAAMHLSG